MSLKKLSADVQSLLTSSIKVDYKRAVEELVYNALDAQSTSVAIRINLQEKKIQVIDNGIGISKSNLSLIGQKHVTSKFINEDNLKSVPQMFGYKGQALASIIEVSRNVKITSRSEITEDTWVKLFYKGSETSTCQSAVRPSKGTTVEINGLLYNLPIQEKLLNFLSELQDMKLFLRQVSLAHSHVSFSLRDDSKNEIVFKVHKNRDIYQTLQSLFEIGRKDIQELKVEKRQYKVVAYIGKTDAEINDHWIYLNKRFIGDSKLHTKVNEYINKYLIQKEPKDKSKLKFNFKNKESSRNYIPFYYIFVTCPYSDYDVNYDSKMARVEFKSWEQMNKLLEKLVSFYAGNREDLKIVSETKTIKNSKDTREKVKQIIHKIMSSNSKIIDVSKMHKGIKSKDIKRKFKKSREDATKSSKASTKIKLKQNEVKESEFEFTKVKNKENIDLHTPILKQDEEINIKKPNIVSKKIMKNKVKDSNKNRNKKSKLNKILGTKKQGCRDPVVEKFENGTESVKQRFEALANQVNDLVKKYKHTKNDINRSEIIENNNFISNNRNISIRKRVNEVVIHKYIPVSPPNKKKYSCNVNNFPHGSTYDLVQTIEKFQHSREDFGPNTPKNKIIHPHYSNSKNNIYDINDHQENILNLCCQQSQRLTYDSHKNCKYRKFEAPVEKKYCTKFITKTSKENFEKDYIRTKVKCGKIFKVVSRQRKDRRQTMKPLRKQSVFHELHASYNYSIEYSESSRNFNSKIVEKAHEDGNQIFTKNSKELNKTYSIVNNDINLIETISNISVNNNDKTLNSDQEIINKKYLDDDNDSVVFVTISQPKIQDNDLCSLLIHDVIEKEDSRNDMKYNKVFSDSGVLENKMDTSNRYHQIRFSKNQETPTIVQKSRTMSYHGVSGENDNKENYKGKEGLLSQTINVHTDDANNFTFNNRMRFLPKGMSQIFSNCNSKTVCKHNIDEEYFGNTIYNNFINDVEINAQVFRPNMQNVNEYSTKDIEKVNRRLHKDNASLVFDSKSLKKAKILKQVDEKFIAATISGKVKHTKESSKVLVLFDQHAVHERIRLEDNLSEYLSNNEWLSIDLESTMNVKLSKENMLYLHNYSEKFKQFGLDWTVLDGEQVQINAIPKAVLGKNNRSPEIILKSVKNLIIEEVLAIHGQKGCTSLYPKSIMDLVSSEACRYAIKFGDRLSKSVCAGLILSLSDCKTPFQCAHGRPVMAVIMDLQEVDQEYMINIDSVKKYRKLRSDKNDK